jgi:O-antigen ligase/Flp pilus assembly protein TadD
MEHPRAAVAVVALVPLVILAVDPGGWYPFGPVKWLVVSAVVPIGVAVLWWHRPARPSRAASLAAAALVAWMALAATLGRDPFYAFLGTPERHFGLVGWLLCVLALIGGHTIDLDDARDRAAVLGALLLAGAGVGGLAVAEALGWEPSILAVTDGRLSGTMGSAAYLGAVGALLLPVAVGGALDTGLGRRSRLLAGSVAAMLGVAVVGSGARAAWVGLVGAGVVVLIAKRSVLLASRRRAALVLVAIGMGLGALLILTPVGARTGAALDADAPGGRGRVDEWRVATRVVVAHPFVGVGPEGYRVAFAEGADDAYEQVHGRDPLPDRAHAAPLDVAVAGGVPALVAWSAIVVLLVVAAGRAIASGRPWIAGLAAGLLAHLTGQVLLFPTAELEPVAWLLGGALLGTFAGPLRTVPRIVPRPALVALGMVGLVALGVGLLDIDADRHAHAALEAARQDDGGSAVDEARTAVALRPDELRLRLLLAQMLLDDQQGTAPAIAAIDDGLRVTPDDPIARRQRAQLLVQRAASTHLPDDARAARRELESLTARDPSNASLHLLLGTADRLDDDAAAAEAAFTRAAALAPRQAKPRVELARLYLDTNRPSEARGAVDEALALEPTDAAALDLRRRLDTSD